MEEAKDTKGNSSGGFPLVASSSLQGPTNSEPPTFLNIDEIIDVNSQNRADIKDSEPLPNNFDDGLPPIQIAASSSEILDELQITCKGAIYGPSEVYSLPVPHKLDQSEELYHEQSHKFKDESTIIVDEVRINTGPSKLQKSEARLHLLTSDLNYSQEEIGNIQKKTSKLSDHLRQVIENRGLINTAAPFESVKEVITKFGGHVDWKAQKAMVSQKQWCIQLELEKIQPKIPKKGSKGRITKNRGGRDGFELKFILPNYQ